MQVERIEIPLVSDTACGAGALKGETIPPRRDRELLITQPMHL